MSRRKLWDQCTPAERIERWENVVRVARALTPHERRKHFNMGCWLVKDKCGTVACLGGFCALDPWFRRRGFGAKVRIDDFSWTGLAPHEFFGTEGTNAIFTNPHFTSQEDGGIDLYRAVVAETKHYIKMLKRAAKEAETA
jgi:hypothetical protein